MVGEGSGPRAEPSAVVQRAGGEATASGAFKRALGVLAGLSAMIGATYLIPMLRPLCPWVQGSGYIPFWNVVGREWLNEGEALQAEASSVAELSQVALAAPQPSAVPAPQPSVPNATEGVFPPYAPPTLVARPQHGIEPIEALDPYYRKLALADLRVPFSIARAGHWGDSVLGVDGITSGIRRRLQARFGDAGHGFHLMDRYHGSYLQQGIEFQPGGGWRRCLIVQGCNNPDRHYGYGGLSVQSITGSAATWSMPRQGFGQTVSLFEFWFARHPQGGRAEIIVDRDTTFTVDTRGPKLEDSYQLVYLPQGAQSFTVRSLGNGVRAYGVVFENDGPGVVWDGMALIGGSTRSLRQQDPGHISQQIRRRGLDMIVFMFGGNDLQRRYADLHASMDAYYAEFGEVLRNFRAAKQNIACLIMSVTDHGKRTAGGAIVSVRFGKALAEAQREVSRRNGCGFFDTYEAMGGEGTAARWYRARPQLISPDLGHPNGLGHEVIAGLLANAILYGYQDYRLRMQGKPLPELETEPLPGELSQEPEAAQKGAGEESAGGDTEESTGPERSQ